MAVYEPTLNLWGNLCLYATLWQLMRTLLLTKRTKEKPLKAFLGKPGEKENEIYRW